MTPTSELLAATEVLKQMQEVIQATMDYADSPAFAQKNKLPLNSVPFRITFDPARLTAAELVPYLDANGSIGEGIFHTTTMRSLVDIIAKDLTEPSRNLGGVFGGTAAGKTALMSSLFFIAPVITSLVRNLRQIPVLSLGSNTEVRSWFLLDMSIRSLLIKAINIEYNGNTINVYDFWHGQVFKFRQTERWYKQYVVMRENHHHRKFYKRKRDPQTSITKTLTEIKQIADTYFLMVDELQHGAKKDSLLDELLDVLSLAFKSPGRNFMFSATPSVLLAAHLFFPNPESFFVEMWCNRHYIGSVGFNGLNMWDENTNDRAIARLWKIENYDYLTKTTGVQVEWDEDNCNRWWKAKQSKHRKALKLRFRHLPLLSSHF
jgi:hypothetical protein